MSAWDADEGPDEPWEGAWEPQGSYSVPKEPRSEATSIIERYLRTRSYLFAQALEDACERSLVDPQQRGVFVDGQRRISLSEGVPYGQIHYAPIDFGQPPRT